MPERQAASKTPVTVCAVVPVYNHPTTIAAVVASIRRYELPVILVDDGGDAACAAAMADIAAHDETVTVLTREHNGGKGSAVMAGARRAQAMGFSHALIPLLLCQRLFGALSR